MSKAWKLLQGGVLAAGGGLLAYAAGIEPYAIELVKFDLLCPRLPKSFDGLTILQVSDLHMRRLGRRERKIASLASQESPDIVAFTGDLVHTPAGIKPFLAMAASFRARLGTYAVYGNSEHKNGILPEKLAATLATNGIEPLLNRHVLVDNGTESIYVCGVDDPVTRHDDLGATMKAMPGDAFKLLLMHSPDNISEAAFLGADFVLSGHTHGGQVRLPLIGPLYARSILGRGMSSGYYGGEQLRHLIGRSPGHTQLYVSRGVGISGLTLRLLCRPEMTLITLRSL